MRRTLAGLFGIALALSACSDFTADEIASETLATSNETPSLATELTGAAPEALPFIDPTPIETTTTAAPRTTTTTTAAPETTTTTTTTKAPETTTTTEPAGLTADDALGRFGIEVCTDDSRDGDDPFLGHRASVEVTADLDADNLDDYVVVVVCSTGNIEWNNAFVVTGTGDQTQLNFVDRQADARLGFAVEHEGGVLSTEWFRFIDGDANCCPSLRDVVNYQFVDGELVMILPQPLAAADTTTTPEATDTTTPTTEAPETPTTEAPETETTEAPAQPASNDIVNVTTAGGDSLQIHASTANQYPAGEDSYWAVSMTYFALDVEFTEIPVDTRPCIAREFLRTGQGQQLVQDDINGNFTPWVDGEGWPLGVLDALAAWVPGQTVC